MSMMREILEKAVRDKASDIHLKTGQVPFFRCSGHLRESGFEALDEAFMRELVNDIVPPHLLEVYNREHETDFSHAEPGIGRFRANVFNSQGAPALVMRYVKDKIPTVEQLRLPPQIRKLAQVERGIILMAGTTGSGKSTTLAAIIGEINRTQCRRIITVEDPVEYVFDDIKSLVTQREVGLDTPGFESALKHMMRQDPDVILIGEMRDSTSIRTAFLAAETGHLVLSTLHAGTADLAIPRMIDVFPSHERENVRMAIAANLHAVVCQRLVPDVDGGVIPAVEIMINTSTVRKLLERGQLDVLAAAIATGREDGMQTFNQSIYDHIRSGICNETEGMANATNPESLRMNLQGIFLDEGSRILGG
ncbi:MAG TPA: twitching motility protein [Verrucomicrobia bacterium]|nr:twitching motility protein [Verrucomicrobiota bacterium]